MITIKNLTVKNFMSVGNATQAIDFDRHDLTLVLGENFDLGSNGARNGTGKTTIINALSYALYGNALSKIKLNNLINKTNQKAMLVSIDFDIDNVNYRIERGRKPLLLKYFINDEEQKDDEARGEKRDTQAEIAKLLNFSHEMFKHIIALNTYTEPFLSMREGDQRNIIEQLLGITLLTEKADVLRKNQKDTKNSITKEEFRIEALVKANEHIEDQIKKLKMRQSVWQKKTDETINELYLGIEKLMDVDIDTEIQSFNENAADKIQVDIENTKAKADVAKLNLEEIAKVDKNKAVVEKYNAEVKDCNKWIESLENDNVSIERRMAGLEKDIQLINDHKCHACGQELHDEKQEENKLIKEKALQDLALQFLTNETQDNEHKLKLSELGPLPDLNILDHINIEADIKEYNTKDTFYDSIDDAHGHKSTLDTLTAQLETAIADSDPYVDQIIEMQDTGVVEIVYNEMNRLVEMKDHQAFLLKLLTSKDSFIRRKIIEQNLNYLNGRLTYYLDQIGLPHRVVFQSDLSVEITELGRDLDFDNLSRGERTRLILSLSWAFRDVHESLYSHINLMFVDELIDSGLDISGVEAALKLLKDMARERNKSVWLVSHREELVSRVQNTMTVVKQGGFTSYEGLLE